MKLFFTFCLIFLFSKLSWCQDCYTYKSHPVKPCIETQCSFNKYFSPDLNLKLGQFFEIYTDTIPSYGRDLPSIQIKKPDLYYSIKKISDYYSKCIKKGLLSEDQAEKEFKTILEKCILIYPDNTDKLEADLRSNNHPENIIKIFRLVRII